VTKSNLQIAPHRLNFKGSPIDIFPDRADVYADLLPFYDYWMETCGGEIPLPRSAIDPVSVPTRILPWLYIINVKRDPLDFNYRLIGTGLTRLLNRDLTGENMSDLYYPPDHNAFLMHRLHLVAEENLVALAEFDAGWVQKKFIKLVSLMLPGTTDGETTDLIFGVTVKAE
jgi:hypothetical protein